MLSLYNPATGTFQPSTGGQQGGEQVLLNVLIELRVMNAIMLDSQRGVVTQTIEQYRADVVSET